MSSIKLKNKYNSLLSLLDQQRGYHAKKKGIKAKSTVAGKDISFLCPDKAHLGKNVDESISCGTVEEVKALTAEITEELGDLFVHLGYAEYVE